MTFAASDPKGSSLDAFHAASRCHRPPVSRPLVPPGGIYGFVAEMRAEGGATRVDAYCVTGRGKILDWFTPWLEGHKDRCPAFD